MGNSDKCALDTHCQVLFCENCFFAELERTSNERRLWECKNRCDKNHLIHLSKENQPGPCDLCKKVWFIKFNCMNCTKFYCTKCIPPKNYNVCYCSKLLNKNVNTNEVIICLRCSREDKGGYSCHYCMYDICSVCYSGK
jgi:hypothetical protein